MGCASSVGVQTTPTGTNATTNGRNVITVAPSTMTTTTKQNGTAASSSTSPPLPSPPPAIVTEPLGDSPIIPVGRSRGASNEVIDAPINTSGFGHEDDVRATSVVSVLPSPSSSAALSHYASLTHTPIHSNAAAAASSPHSRADTHSAALPTAAAASANSPDDTALIRATRVGTSSHATAHFAASASTPPSSSHVLLGSPTSTGGQMLLPLPGTTLEIPSASSRLRMKQRLSASGANSMHQATTVGSTTPTSKQRSGGGGGVAIQHMQHAADDNMLRQSPRSGLSASFAPSSFSPHNGGGTPVRSFRSKGTASGKTRRQAAASTGAERLVDAKEEKMQEVVRIGNGNIQHVSAASSDSTSSRTPVPTKRLSPVTPLVVSAVHSARSTLTSPLHLLQQERSQLGLASGSTYDIEKSALGGPGATERSEIIRAQEYEIINRRHPQPSDRRKEKTLSHRNSTSLSNLLAGDPEEHDPDPDHDLDDGGGSLEQSHTYTYHKLISHTRGGIEAEEERLRHQAREREAEAREARLRANPKLVMQLLTSPGEERQDESDAMYDKSQVINNSAYGYTHHTTRTAYGQSVLHSYAAAYNQRGDSPIQDDDAELQPIEAEADEMRERIQVPGVISQRGAVKSVIQSRTHAYGGGGGGGGTHPSDNDPRSMTGTPLPEMSTWRSESSHMHEEMMNTTPQASPSAIRTHSIRASH